MTGLDDVSWFVCRTGLWINGVLLGSGSMLIRFVAAIHASTGCIRIARHQVDYVCTKKQR